MSVNLSCAQYSRTRPAGRKYYYLLFSVDKAALALFCARVFNGVKRITTTFDQGTRYNIMELSPDEAMAAERAGAPRRPDTFIKGTMRAGLYVANQ